MNFGFVNGKNIEKYTISNGVISVDVLNYGAIIHSLKVPDKNGVLTDIVLGYNTIEEYVKDDAYVGAVIYFAQLSSSKCLSRYYHYVFPYLLCV